MDEHGAHFGDSCAEHAGDFFRNQHDGQKNIEEQNNMTQSIQSAIDETGERSRKMVDVATDPMRIFRRICR